ncbi:MAG TPA: peptidoglycan DD-metalloendopeptidase family protein [Solimonas sp.]|nr:peptidoglycan DD-metalloendopeptidase family protein [Solimonas sp.]
MSRFLPLPAALCLSLLLAGCAGWSSWEDGRQRPAPVVPEIKPERPLGVGEYMVRAGDTVYSIAFRNSLDYRELARWNEIGNTYLIYPGQVLRLSPPPKPRHQVDDIESESVEDVEPIRPRVITADTPPPVAIAPAIATGGSEAAVPDSYEWIWPTNGVVFRGWNQGGNKGLDFTGREGQPIFAAAPGRVVYSGNALKGYGELIIIKHDELFLSAYGYNRSRYVKEGDVVTAGQPIAEMGRGPENKPLLHFEVRERGKPVNPVDKLPAKTAANP